MNPLLEQAARVLDHQPTRSMEAEPLYRKAVRESGVEMPFPRFVESLRSQAVFAVIEPDPVADVAAEWDPRHRSLYRAALEAAGLAHPVVILAERLHDTTDESRAVSPATPAAVLGDVHDALTHLLRTADADDTLFPAVASALEQLHVLRTAFG